MLSPKPDRQAASRDASDAAANGSTAPPRSRRGASCDQTGVQIYLPIEHPGQSRRMRHHQKAAAGTLHQIPRERENLIRGGLVEIAGRLIGLLLLWFFGLRVVVCF